ncbi:MAG: hypothetical protein M1830_005987 [Pleopsidium flavum]|nr:MAG: hypothetical protein M1830_005987 [Pleopsidium flavum]
MHLLHKSPTSLEDLPVDLKLVIFCALPDISCLKALVRTSSAFYQTFLDSQLLVVRTVLSNGVHPDVMPEALTVWEASQIMPWSKERVQDYLKQYRDSSTSPTKQLWTLSDGLRFSNLHSHVRSFTADFCSAILSVHPITGVHDPAYRPPSPSELCRIQRIFYRFELCCTLYRRRSFGQKDKDRFSPEEQQNLFFKKFECWENEQLACIHDYLFRRLSVAYDEVAEHDVQWGEDMIDVTYDWKCHSFSKEGYLSQGLEFLHRVVSADTYDERYAVLASVVRSDDRFLDAGLQEQGECDDYNGSEQSSEEDHDSDIPVLSANDDSGPTEAWCWANGHHISYYQPEMMDLREWGFCLWDKSRLMAWGLFRKPWTPTGVFSKRDRLSKEASQKRDWIRKSWEERSRIWQRGGRGWWNWGDISKVAWTYGAKHAIDAEAYKRQSSDFWEVQSSLDSMQQAESERRKKPMPLTPVPRCRVCQPGKTATRCSVCWSSINE